MKKNYINSFVIFSYFPRTGCICYLSFFLYFGLISQFSRQFEFTFCKRVFRKVFCQGLWDNQDKWNPYIFLILITPLWIHPEECVYLCHAAPYIPLALLPWVLSAPHITFHSIVFSWWATSLPEVLFSAQSFLGFWTLRISILEGWKNLIFM